MGTDSPHHLETKAIMKLAEHMDSKNDNTEWADRIKEAGGAQVVWDTITKNVFFQPALKLILATAASDPKHALQDHLGMQVLADAITESVEKHYAARGQGPQVSAEEVGTYRIAEILLANNPELLEKLDMRKIYDNFVQKGGDVAKALVSTFAAYEFKTDGPSVADIEIGSRMEPLFLKAIKEVKNQMQAEPVAPPLKAQRSTLEMQQEAVLKLAEFHQIDGITAKTAPAVYSLLNDDAKKAVNTLVELTISNGIEGALKFGGSYIDALKTPLAQAADAIPPSAAIGAAAKRSGSDAVEAAVPPLTKRQSFSL
jgi:hypothetical protein